MRRRGRHPDFRRRRYRRRGGLRLTKKRYLRRVLSHLGDAFETGRIRVPADLDGALTTALAESFRPRDLRAGLSIGKAASAATQTTIRAASEVLAESIAQDKGILEEERKMFVGFEERLAERWEAPLRLTRLLRYVAVDAAISFIGRHEPAVGNWKLKALVRLHARACLISSEVLALLRTGHASGAHARWRALHEVAVVANFIGDHDQETARRYLLHVVVDKFELALDHQKFAPLLGHEPIEDSAVEELREHRKSLLKELGPAYAGTYGWAAHILGSGARFSDIENAVELSKWRPYYRWASEPIHATAKALTDDLGMLGADPGAHAGPSNAGLADPGHSMCISLNQVTVSLLLRSEVGTPNIGDVAILNVLGELVQAAGDEFLEASNQLLRDEEEAAKERAELPQPQPTSSGPG